MDLSEEMVESRSHGIVLSTSKRVRMIFSVMASPNRIAILRMLNSQGSLTYSELKGLAGFRSKKDSGKFAYHLRKILRQSLVALNRAEKRYTITNLGKLVLNLARQIEERSVIEGGKMYVRTSHASIEEFHSYKIGQSLVREGSLPPELADKITEEVENRIYKCQPSYLTGSLIRELVNSVLLEHNQEVYRNKLVRLGLPAHDLQEMLSNVDGIDNGTEGLFFRAGQSVFAERLLTNTLPKDVADSHLGGDVHITNPGLWSLIPDTIFLNAKELADDGLDLGGKFLNASRIRPAKTLDCLSTAMSMLVSLISREASQEAVLDGLPALVASRSAGGGDLAAKMLDMLVAASTALRYGSEPPLVSFRLQLGIDSDAAAVDAIVSAYLEYVRATPLPRIGLVIDREKGGISAVSGRLAAAVQLGGHVAFIKGRMSVGGIANRPARGSGPSIYMQSLSVNMARLALESNKDATYFRARLALLLGSTLAALSKRKREITDLTRRGLNPILAKNTQYMQRGSVALVVNLVGLREAVYGVLGAEGKEGRAVLYKTVETAADVAAKKGEEFGDDIRVCMADSDGRERLALLDGEKYSKADVRAVAPSGSYSGGFSLDAGVEYDPGGPEMEECARLSRMLGGGLLVRLEIGSEMDIGGIREAIERTAAAVNSFKPVRIVSICGACGYKDAQLAGRCPECKSPHIISR